MLTRVLEANMSLLLVMLVLQVMLGSIVNHVCLKKPFLFEKKKHVQQNIPECCIIPVPHMDHSSQ